MTKEDIRLRKKSVLRHLRKWYKAKRKSVQTLSIINTVQLAAACFLFLCRVVEHIGDLGLRFIISIAATLAWMLRTLFFSISVSGRFFIFSFRQFFTFLYTILTGTFIFLLRVISPVSQKKPQKLFSVQLGFRPSVTKNTNQSHVARADLAYPPFMLPHRWYAGMFIFILISIVLVVPFHFAYFLQHAFDVRAQTQNFAKTGLSEIEAGKSAFEQFKFDEARSHFSLALTSFNNASDEIHDINSYFVEALKYAPIKGSAITDGQRIIDVGKKLSQAAESLASSIPPLSEGGLTAQTLYQSLEKSDQTFKHASTLISDASSQASLIQEGSMPVKYRSKFIESKTSLKKLSKNINEASSLISTIKDVLGGTYQKRYLVVLQNNGELRPTGGFIGTFSLVDINRGEIKKIETPGGGSYDLQGSLREQVISPYALHLINPAWQFQDANWFPDFPASARKLMWFYEKSGGPTVDGVIAINASIASDLLALVGPIDMPEYGKIITSKNFLLETQKAVELDYDKTKNKPKQFLADLFPKLLEKLMALKFENSTDLARIFVDAAINRDVQVYLTDSESQRALSSYGLSGELQSTSLDYLMVVDSSVAGGKSDAAIEESIKHAIHVRENGQIEATVSVTKDHKGDPKNPFYGAKNIDYIRFYVPKGSTLISAHGFSMPDATLFKSPPPFYQEDKDLRTIEGRMTLDKATHTYINDEFGKTVFAHWIQANAGEKTTASLSYVLPFTIADLQKSSNHEYLYTLYVQEQSGRKLKNYTLDMTTAKSHTFLWTSPEATMGSNHSHWSVSDKRADSLFSTIFK